MARIDEEIEKIMDKDFCMNATSRALSSTSIEPQSYGELHVSYRNDQHSETAYTLDFGDEESITAYLNPSRSSKAFYFLEGVSQGLPEGHVATQVYTERKDLTIDLEGVLDDGRRLVEAYRQPLSAFLQNEIWK